MTILGAILAGGRSSRFGSDKAFALLDGRPLLNHVAAGLREQVDTLITCGREWPGLTGVPDYPAPDLGPLGGLCAALRHARAQGHELVLTAGCDVLPIPDDLVATLGIAPAYIDGQPLLGLWPASLSSMLEARLGDGGDRSIRGWANATGARAVASAIALHNFNRPEALARYRPK